MRDLSIFKFCVEDDGISTVVGPLLDLKSLFTLSVCNTKLNKDYRPFIALLLQKENAASRMGRLCLRERRRMRKLNPSAPKIWIYMNNTERFQNLDPSSNFKIETRLSRGEGSNTQTFTSDIVIRIDLYEPIMYVTVWNGLHLEQHARFIENQPGVEIPAYKGEGEDPQIRNWKKHCWRVVLDLNGRQWVGETWNRSSKILSSNSTLIQKGMRTRSSSQATSSNTCAASRRSGRTSSWASMAWPEAAAAGLF
jgi:hypothetical protein